MAFANGRPFEPGQAFFTLVKFRAKPDEELRSEETFEARYHGRAALNTLTSAAVWEIVKFDRDGDGEVVRTRYLSNVKWDDRATVFS